MKTLNLALLTTGLLIGGSAVACEHPSLVEIPDGATSSLNQMLEAQRNMRGYVDAMVNYLACIEEEMDVDAQPGASPSVVRSLLDERYNGAVKEMETMAAAFYRERLAFAETNPPAPARPNAPGL